MRVKKESRIDSARNCFMKILMNISMMIKINVRDMTRLKEIVNISMLLNEG